MSFTPRPCAHCQSPNFHVIPNVQAELWTGTTVLGMNASQKVSGGRRWTFSLLICAQCGRTETFTSNGPQMASWIGGSSQMTTTRTD